MFVGVCMSNINGICRHYIQSYTSGLRYDLLLRGRTLAPPTFIASLPPSRVGLQLVKICHRDIIYQNLHKEFPQQTKEVYKE